LLPPQADSSEDPNSTSTACYLPYTKTSLNYFYQLKPNFASGLQEGYDSVPTLRKIYHTEAAHCNHVALIWGTFVAFGVSAGFA
jgi:hypothetical protein